MTTKNDLERLEAGHDRLLTSRNADSRKLDKVGHIFCPGVVEPFGEMVDNLEAVTLGDMTRARAQLRRLIGETPLHPKDGYLTAELTGIMSATFGSSM